MLSKLTQAGMGVLMALMVAPGWPALAQTDTSPNTIHALVFEDTNGDGMYQEGELGLPEVEVFAGAAAAEFTGVTAADGWVWLPATAGEWSVSVRAPQGYELTNDDPMLVVFDQPGDQEVTVHIGLRQTAAVVGESELESEAQATPSPEPDPVETEVADLDDQPASDEEDVDDLPLLLPESGATLHPLIGLGAATILLLGGGAVLLKVGRRMER